MIEKKGLARSYESKKSVNTVYPDPPTHRIQPLFRLIEDMERLGMASGIANDVSRKIF